MNICKNYTSKTIFHHSNLNQCNFPREDLHLQAQNNKINQFVRWYSSNFEVFDREKLKENQQIADQVIHYVRNTIQNVGTRGMEHPITAEKCRYFKQFNEVIGEQRDLRKLIILNQPKEKQNTFVSHDIAAFLAKTSGCGNCSELATVGLMYFSEISLGRAGMFSVERPENAPLPEGISSPTDSEHAFLIIGLDSNEIKRNQILGGANAVVADPYSEESSYPLSEMNVRLKNYYGLDSQARPMLANFDPAIDSINLVCSHILSGREFLEPFLIFKAVSPDANEIATLLNSFNISTSRENRISIAHEIISKMPVIITKLDKLDELTIETSKFFENHMEQMKQLLQEGDETCLAHVKNFHEIFIAAKQIVVCRDNVYSLHSQLEKFINPESLSFNLE